MCDLSFESAAQAICASCLENNTASFAMLHSQLLVLLLHTFRDLHLQYLSFKWNRGLNFILLFLQHQLINQFEKFQQSDSLKAVVFLVNLIQLQAVCLHKCRQFKIYRHSSPMNKQLRVSYVCIVILGLEHFLFCLLQKFSFLVKVVYVILFSKVALMKYLAVWCLSVSGS